MSFLFCTKVRTIIPICPCGPPKAVKEYKVTAFRKGMCRRNIGTNPIQEGKLATKTGKSQRDYSILQTMFCILQRKYFTT